MRRRSLAERKTLFLGKPTWALVMMEARLSKVQLLSSPPHLRQAAMFWGRLNSLTLLTKLGEFWKA